MPSGITSATNAASFAGPTGAGSAILGKDDFLRLLTMQLRYQDPMNPLEGTEFASQLAQFSSVEQLANMNTTLQESVQSNSLMTQSINNALSTTFVGKEVRALTSSFHYSGSDEVKLGYTLDTAAEKVTVKVLDKNGNVIKTIQGLSTDAGENTFEWDGTRENGTAMNAGDYTFEVTATDKDGATIGNSQFIYGTVDSIRFKTDGTVFVIDGVEVALSKIMEIMKG